MLNSDQWWSVISNYNESIFPFQLIVIIIGVIILLNLIYGPKARANAIMKAYLSFCNLWIGIVFFIIMSTDFPSPQREIQGALFIVIGILFAIDIFTKKTEFTIANSRMNKYIILLLFIGIAVYPLVGLITRDSYTKIIYPGTLPCATTAYALALLSMSLPKVNKTIFILLLVWAIPFAPLIQIPKYHVFEDSIMLSIGIFSLIMLITSIIKSKKSNLNKER